MHLQCGGGSAEKEREIYPIVGFIPARVSQQNE